MTTLRAALAAIAIAAVPLLAFAQATLPQSTQDRQEIQNLQFRANQPGTSTADRAQIARRITELQYQINTRPAIEPMPTLTPGWNGASLPGGKLPQLSDNPQIAPISPTIYGSCDADRAVIAYLEQEMQLPSTSRQERLYEADQKAQLEKDLRAKGC